MLSIVDNTQEIYQFTIIAFFLVAIVFFLAMFWYSSSLERTARSEEQARQALKVNTLELDKAQLKNSILEVESRAKVERNLRLEQEATFQKNELISTTMLLGQQQGLLTILDTMIANVEKKEKITHGDLSRIRHKIHANLALEEGWKSFREQFLKVHPQFFKALTQDYPKLTQNDHRHCAYIKMGLNTKEIAQLLNINPTSVQIARVRLKKKMHLSKEQNLVDLIKSI